MQVKIGHFLVASLLGSAAFVPAAFAQEAVPAEEPVVQQPAGEPMAAEEPTVAEPAEQDVAMAAECEELQGIADENQDRFQDDWVTEARAAIDAGDTERCVLFIESAEEALAQLETDAAAADTDEGGRLVLDIPDPTVTVQQEAPEVTVTQPDPEVTVTQAQPEIIVRQAQPTVRIQMPQPTVTIDQPQPEIIVRMPDPEVAVAQVDPEITVEQADPVVTVERDEPEVDVAAPQEAEVVLEEENQAVVSLVESEGEAEVQVESAQPQVTYEPAEPNVEFESAGEPQVEFTQSGEPQVTFEEGAEGEQAAAEGEAAEGEIAAAEGEAAEGEMALAQTEVDPEADPALEAEPEAGMDLADWRGERAPLVPPAMEVEGYTATEPASVELEQLEGAEVYGPDEEQIADVESAVIGPEGQIQYFVMDVGGFLGIGERRVAVGLDEVTVLTDAAGGTRVYVDASQEQLEALPEYEG